MSIKDKSFTIVANGFADGPSQALRDYLIVNHAKQVVVISHPLVPESNGTHTVHTHIGSKIIRKQIAFINKPPLTYLADPFIPLIIPNDDVWFGFNNLSCLRGLLRRRLGKSKHVVYWAVDFVPNRFGSGIATRVYDLVDKFVAKRVDLRIDLSHAALEGRTKRISIPSTELAPSLVVPMGAWLDRTPKTSIKTWQNKKIVYLGHLVERQGVSLLVDALHELHKEGLRVRLDIIGAGPLLDKLKKQASTLGISKHITFHGFVKDHKEVESILANACVAVAPYRKDPSSFTQYADPGKLKAYMGAYLPIVLTNVPPNATEIQDAGAALIVEDNPASIAAGIKTLLSNKATWEKAHISSKKLAITFDWNRLLKAVLEKLDSIS